MVEQVIAPQIFLSNEQLPSFPQRYIIHERNELANPNRKSDTPMLMMNQFEFTFRIEGVDRAIQMRKALPNTAKIPIPPKMGLYHCKVGP